MKLIKKYSPMIIGVLIILAYSMLVGLMTESVLIIFLADLVSGLAVIGIAILFWPVFVKINKNLGMSYLILKIFEGLLMVGGGAFYLFDSMKYLRDIFYDKPHTYSFIVSGFIFYYLLLKSKVVPRFIAFWGLVAIFAMLIINAANLIGINTAAIEFLLVLIIANEVFLAGWLMVKGFGNY